jgi:DNA repair exonuclease SbcCD ATPase subunit
MSLIDDNNRLRREIGALQKELDQRRASDFRASYASAKYVELKQRVRELEAQLLNIRRNENVSVLKEKLRNARERIEKLKQRVSRIEVLRDKLEKERAANGR